MGQPVEEPVIEPWNERTDDVFKEIVREEGQQALEQTTQETLQESEQESHDQATASLGSTLGSKKRARSNDDTTSDEKAAQRLRAKKGKAIMIEQPKKKKSRAERQRKGFELRTSSTPLVTAAKSSEIPELRETIKKMDGRISAQAKIIRAQSARINDQDDVIKDMHTLLTYQGAQIDSLSQAFSLFS